MAKLKHPKQKGNSHERNVAKLLSEWSGEQFIRTPGSGAMHNVHDRRVVSDIVAPESLRDFPFSIECKNTEISWELNTFLEGTGDFWSHWNQSLSDAEREDMLPMLVFTKNYRGIYMAIRLCEYRALGIFPHSYSIIIREDTSIVIMDFKEFLSIITVEDLMKKLSSVDRKPVSLEQ